GFTTGTPWINVNPNYTWINVAESLADPNSIFHYYQKLIRLRRENPVIVYGRFDLILDSPEGIYAFVRTLEEDCILVLLNFGPSPQIFTRPNHLTFTDAEQLISNYEVNAEDTFDEITLRPFEARAYRLR